MIPAGDCAIRRGTQPGGPLYVDDTFYSFLLPQRPSTVRVQLATAARAKNYYTQLVSWRGKAAKVGWGRQKKAASCDQV